MEDVRNACIKLVKDVNGIDIPVIMTFTSIKMRPNPDHPSGTILCETVYGHFLDFKMRGGGL